MRLWLSGPRILGGGPRRRQLWPEDFREPAYRHGNVTNGAKA